MTEQDGPSVGVPLHRRIDVLAGALACLLALVIWWGSRSLATGELRYFGPGFLPRILAGLLLICGLAVLLRGLMQGHAAAERLALSARGPAMVSLAILVFALTIRGHALGPLGVPQLGLLISGPAAVFLAGMGSVEARPRELIVLGLGMSALTALIFVEMLSVQLPLLPAAVGDNLPEAWGPDWLRRLAVALWLAAAFGCWRAFGLTLEGLRDGAGAERE